MAAELGGILVPVGATALRGRDAGLMQLGTVMPQAAEFTRLVDRYRDVTEQRLREAGTSQAAGLSRALSVMGFEQYLDTLQRFAHIRHEIDQRRLLEWEGRTSRKPPIEPAVEAFVERGNPRAYSPDLMGWLAYVQDVAPALSPKLAQLAGSGGFSEHERRMHTLVVAPNGHGKSELLKALVWHYVEHPGPAVVVIDPAGDMCRQIAQWPELLRSGRLVYVEPYLRPGYTVGINPFAGGHLLDDRMRSRLAGVIAGVLGEITGNLTPQMQTLTRNCCTVLLGLPDATLHDLILLVRKPRERSSRAVKSFDVGEQPDVFHDRRQQLLRAAFLHKNRFTREYFNNDFDEPEVLGTRGWLGARLQTIASMADLRDALFGKDTLNLQAAMDSGKVVIVNLRQYGDEDERSIVGRVLVCLIAALGQQRGRLPVGTNHHPVQVFIDETSSLASDRMITILEELRKFGVHLTLAQQVGGRGFTPEMKASLIKNTQTKIIADPHSKKDGATLLSSEIEPKDLPDLKKRQFWVRWCGDTQVRHLEVRSDLADRTHRVSDAEWAQFVERATGPGGYYRPASALDDDEAPALMPAPDSPPERAALPAILASGRVGSPRPARARQTKAKL